MNRRNFCATIILLLATVFSSAAQANWLCDILFRKATSPREFIVADGISGKVPVPIGLNPSYVREYVNEMMTNKSVGGLLLFGSRTHFDYGYQPKLKSDLDIFVFQGGFPFPDLWDAQFTESNKLGQRHGIEAQIVMSRRELSFKGAIEHMATSFQYPSSQAEEMWLFEQAGSDVKGFFKRTQEKQNVTDLLSKYPGEDFYFNKQAIIIVKASEASAESLAMLTSYGFANIFVYSP